MRQSIVDWHVYLTVDPCGDETYAAAIDARAGDQRIRIKKNATRQYSMRNQVEAIARMNADPEDIIVSLDGDDWFEPDALEVIADTYQKHDCWLTYGSWIPDREVLGESSGMWKAYPEGTTDFRNHEWLATAVRTWKKWLWDHVNLSDLKDDCGEYFRIAEDRAIMLPLLEMAGTQRARHIARPIMIYKGIIYMTPSTRINPRPYVQESMVACKWAGRRITSGISSQETLPLRHI